MLRAAFSVLFAAPFLSTRLELSRGIACCFVGVLVFLLLYFV